MTSFSVRTDARRQLVDITDRVSASCPKGDGALLLSVPHTTAALTLNEGYDPDVALDIRDALERLSPAELPRRHAEGNADAHVLASVLGSTLLVPCSRGPELGRWQRIFLVELDGPRTRTVEVRYLPGEEGDG